MHVPTPFIYACQAAMLLAPVLAMVLLHRRRYAIGITIVLFSFFYSRASLAKGPIYIVAGMYGLIAWIHLSKIWQRRLLITGVVAAAPIALYALFFFATSPLSIFRYRIPPAVEANFGKPGAEAGKGDLTVSLPDHFRLHDEYRIEAAGKELPSLNKAELILSFFAYRAFLSPVNVSHHWYTFFPDVYGRYLGLYGLTPSSRNSPGFQHPANALGIWAYFDRFPKYYLRSIQAFASADADAHARGGVLGLFLVGFWIVALRILLHWCVSSSFFSRSLYASSLLILALNLPGASLQAIIVAQGLGVFLSLAIVLKIWERAPIRKWRFASLTRLEAENR